MIKFTPILLAMLYAFLMYKFSVHSSLRSLDRQSHELKHSELDPVIQKLADALDLPKIKVRVLNHDQVNGLAAHDGRVYITKGFLDRLHKGEVNKEEIASVVAHELGHVALGHTKRRMIDFSGQAGLRVFLQILIGRFIPLIGPWIAALVISLISARISRADEYEADAYAAALMTKSGLGTGPQKSLFHKLDRLAGSIGRPPAWLASHPASEERIAAIEEKERSWNLTPHSP